MSMLLRFKTVFYAIVLCKTYQSNQHQFYEMKKNGGRVNGKENH